MPRLSGPLSPWARSPARHSSQGICCLCFHIGACAYRSFPASACLKTPHTPPNSVHVAPWLFPNLFLHLAEALWHSTRHSFCVPLSSIWLHESAPCIFTGFSAFSLLKCQSTSFILHRPEPWPYLASHRYSTDAFQHK